MAYNGSGTYTLPSGNPVISGTVITSVWANTFGTDVKNTFDNVLPRDGQASMTGQLKIANGTSATPSIAFNSASSTGLYLPSTNVLGLVAGGIEALAITANGAVILSASTTDNTSKLQISGNTAMSGNLSVSGNVSLAGNLLIPSGNLSLAANLSAYSITSTGNVSVQGNIGGSNIIATGQITAANTATVTSGNVTTALLANSSSLTGSVGTVSNHPMVFGTNNTEAIRIDTSGQLLANTSVTGAWKLPTGNTSQRPTAATAMMRFNSDTVSFEGYNGTSWTAVGGGATGGVGSYAFYENDQTVSVNYTITAGKNAMSAGPITINTGVTVTVGTGQYWSIV